MEGAITTSDPQQTTSNNNNNNKNTNSGNETNTKKKDKYNSNNNDRPNPAEGASCFSTLLILYMFPIFKRTFRKGLTERDLFRPLVEHKSHVLADRLNALYTTECQRGKRAHKWALHRALFRLVGGQFILIGLLKLLNQILIVVVMPLSIGRLVSYFETDDGGTAQARSISQMDAYLAAGAVILGLLADALISHPTMMALMHISMKLRLACSALLYRKTLRLSRTALGATTVGQMVNLLSNDVSKFDEGFVLAHFAWVGPIQTAVGTWLLYREIGIAAIFGMAFLLSFIPIQIWLGKRTSVLRLKTALRTDDRVRLMNEVLSGIQVIKMYCWEIPFAHLVSLARRKEMRTIRSHAYLLGLMYSFEVFVTRTSIFISILCYITLGNYISAAKVFAITAIYNVLRPVITMIFSISISSLAEVNISIHRIQTFLQFDEIETQESTVAAAVSILPSILLRDISAKWCLTDDTDMVLRHVNFTATNAELVAVIGPVGSGKTSLLNTLLNELPIDGGKMEIVGVVSFSAQEPWLFSASVRNNILFGAVYDEVRYRRVVEVCALNTDFDQLPYGDRTQVGEKGRALSGGQRARVNLARCLYKQADIYLLDDPLSAVDANVGKQLYEMGVRQFLHGKIVVLVTHQLQNIQNADRIVIMKDGCVEIQGKFIELQNSGVDFAHLLRNFEQQPTTVNCQTINAIKPVAGAGDDVLDEEKPPQIQLAEVVRTGSITSNTYWSYFKAGGGMLMALLLAVVFVVGQIVTNAGDYYVSYWVDVEKDFANRPHNTSVLTRNTIIYTYSGITVATILFAIAQSLFFMYFFTVVSVNFHDTTFRTIIRATMRFFDRNPSGRILNRFSKDLGYIDEYIPPVLLDVVEISLQLLGTLILSFMVDQWLIIPSIVLLGVFYFLRVIYIRTSRSVKRIEAITRSPIFTHLTASIQGLTTIRAFRAQDILIREFDSYQDGHSSAWFLFIASNRCFGFWLDMFCITFIAVSIFSLLYIHETIYGGQIGLVITQYIGLIGSLQWGMRQWSELENHMVSVERLLEYQHVETEPNRTVPNKEQQVVVGEDWPHNGKIEFRTLSLKYDLDDVLKAIQFTIMPGEKIGIVGRTGAGKSSMISALFQLYPTCEGTVLIDDVDTANLPLDLVRSKVSIIPQEAVLFSGTVRKNLDPFEQYSDDVLWSVLEQVQLKEAIMEMVAGLNSAVCEGGTNFSSGQRQLVCLARALLRQNRILVLDEATANVDGHTDTLIQRTIRTKFEECTVITIAHRLHTVMDADRVLVMSCGQIVEFDHPYKLLQDPEGYLSQLANATGDTVRDNLKGIAKKNRASAMSSTLKKTEIPTITVTDLPIKFTVKYLGSHPAKGLWGIKHTRGPVDVLVAKAKLPNFNMGLVHFTVQRDRVSVEDYIQDRLEANNRIFPMDTISYGVQDLIYTKVLSMIVILNHEVDESSSNIVSMPQPRFVCHSFLCDSKAQARHITYALAAAFHDYGRRMRTPIIGPTTDRLRYVEFYRDCVYGDETEV